ncbi:hypothetical protein F5883DRAFT_111040 [Diaporthe sp. PMI_573]|nr:hypothetical protein F5883DRAFT_111040 [Diaporthaceae sp. PMI_573]
MPSCIRNNPNPSSRPSQALQGHVPILYWESVCFAFAFEQLLVRDIATGGIGHALTGAAGNQACITNLSPTEARTFLRDAIRLLAFWRMVYGCELHNHVTLARSTIDVVISTPIAPTQGCSKCCDTADSVPLLGIVNQVNQLNKWPGCGFAEGFRATGFLRSLPCPPRVACRLVALVCFFLGTLLVSRWRRSSGREPAAL